jgi:uncharacterized protein (TIGR01777 family)
MKKVVIAGGTGFIGTYLATRFREIGFKVLIVSRNPEHVSWLPNDLQQAVEGAELVINLAGKTINCRHNSTNRKAILESRIKTTKLIGDAISACNEPPKLWVNASASAIYKPSEEKAMTEDETDLATGFLADVVSQWESTFFEFELPKTRQVALRTSVVLGKEGGALKPLAWLSRLGLGGKQAEGTQIVSWLHLEDYFRIIQFLVKTIDINGVVNCTSPNPLTNNDFMSALRNTVSAIFGLPAPRFAIVIGARLIGTEPELLLNSAFLLPKRLQDSGYKFAFPTIEKALADLLK